MTNINDTSFKRILEQFFSKYEFIISGHYGFNWFPEGVSPSSGHISIKQKLKAKCYLGLRIVEDKGIHFRSVEMFDGKSVINYDMGKFIYHYNNSISFLVRELNLMDKNYGYEIGMVSECVRGEGVGFSGTMMSLLVSGIYYLDGKLTLEKLSDYAKFQNSELFGEINRLAHKSTIIAKNGNIGSDFFTTLSKGSHPYVYINDNNESVYENVDLCNEYWKSLPDLFGIKDFPMKTLPVCWALVYTGQKSDSSFAVGQKKFLEYVNMEYERWFDALDISKVKSQLKLGLNKSNYYETKIKNLNNMSINLLYLLEAIYKKGAQSKDIAELIKIMNLINSLYNDVEQDFDITTDFQRSCIKCGVSLDTFGFSPVYTNKYGGNYLVIFEDDSDLDVLGTILDDMKSIYPDIRIRDTFDFDMPAEDGIVIEQDVSSSILRDNCDELYVLVNGKNEQKFVSYTSIDPKQIHGIFFDGVKNKIYVNGNVLTSKDIKSATTTIELFDHLLRSEKHVIKNSELGPSSFSSQQNQMESKIIIPFVKYIRNNLGMELDIECSGSLREFFVSLGKINIDIQLVKRY